MKTMELTPPFPSLEDLLQLAQREAGLILTRSGNPVAQLLPVPDKPKQRVAPLHPGAIEVSDDFDAPLPDEFWLGQP